jgi:hypothetical protein
MNPTRIFHKLFLQEIDAVELIMIYKAKYALK